MRPLSWVFVAIVCAGALASGCVTTTTAEPTLAPAEIETLGAACSGEAVAGAGAVVTDGSSLNHVVMLDTAGRENGWTDWVPGAWRPVSLADTELVICVTEESPLELQVCPYTGGDITRYSVTDWFGVVEPRTGKVLVNFSITDEPRYCAIAEDASITELRGEITGDMVETHLASVVEHGTYVDPNATESPAPGESPAPTPRLSHGPAVEVELRAALADGLVSATGTGNGLTSLDLEVTSLADEPLTVTIEAGTMLDPRARGTQVMVVLWDFSVELDPGATGDVGLGVACAQMNRDQPTSDDTFVVLSDEPGDDLALLLASPDLADAETRVRQFAVWTITNNPRRNGYVGLTTGFEVFGTGPDDEEIGEIKELFETAGIDTSKYRALR